MLVRLRCPHFPELVNMWTPKLHAPFLINMLCKHALIFKSLADFLTLIGLTDRLFIYILQELGVAQTAVTLAVKRRKNARKIKIIKKKYFFCMYLLVMPKYWGGNYFANGSFPEVGQKQKTEKKERERERKLVITMAKLRMAHASTHGARKLPGPKITI